MTKKELKEQLQTAMENKEYDQVEDLWLNLIELDHHDLAPFYTIAGWLARHEERERASLLLLLLTPFFKEKGDYHQLLGIVRKAAVFSPTDKTVRQELIDCYKLLLQDNPQARELIETSGIKGETPLTKILPLFDDYLYFNVGQYFYRQEWGLGRVVESDVLREKRVIIDFEKKKRHSLNLDMVSKILTRLDDNHFLVLKITQTENLKKMAKESALDLLTLLLKSVKQALSVKEIKAYLEGIIREEEWTEWWDKLKQEIKKEAQIEVSSSIPKTYHWSDAQAAEDRMRSKFDKASVYEKMDIAKEAWDKELELANQLLNALIELGQQSITKKPSLAMELFLFVQELQPETNARTMAEEIVRQEEDLTALILRMKGFKYQSQTLKMIKITHPQTWPDIYSALFFDLDGIRHIETIVNELERDKLKPLLMTLYQSHKKYPEKFLWLCKKRFEEEADRDDLLSRYNLLLTLIKLLDSKDTNDLQTKIKALLLSDSLKVLQRCFKESEPEAFIYLYESLMENEGLRISEKEEIKALAQQTHPLLVKPEENEGNTGKGRKQCFYTTQSGLKAKQAELEHIMKVEIPDNSKETAIARSYGDLRENFEYKVAKERQAILFSKAVKLRAQLAQVEVIRPEDVSTEIVSIGTRVRLSSPKGDKEYTLLGPWDIDLEKGIISYLTPLANKLLDKGIGETVILEDGEYKIVEIANGLIA